MSKLPRNASALDIQKSQMEKLLKNPEKSLIEIDKTLKLGIDEVKGQHEFNQVIKQSGTSGSSSAAGAGDFHVYKNTKRKELDRREEEDKQIQKERENEEFERKRQEVELRDNAKTTKNRERRKKRKLKGGSKDNSVGSDVGIDSDRITDNKKEVFPAPKIIESDESQVVIVDSYL